MKVIKIIYTLVVILIFIISLILGNIDMLDFVSKIVYNYSQFLLSIILGLLALTFSFQYNESYNGNLEKLKKKQSKNLLIQFYMLFLIILIEFLAHIRYIKIAIVLNYILVSILLYLLAYMFIYVYREIKYGTR